MYIMYHNMIKDNIIYHILFIIVAIQHWNNLYFTDNYNPFQIKYLNLYFTPHFHTFNFNLVREANSKYNHL